MNYLKKISFLFLIPLSICCCSSIEQEEITGVYVAKNNINTIDTLRILENGTYIKDVYRKNDNSLVYHNTGVWKYEEGRRIILQDFFLDEDQIYSKEAGNFESGLITSSLIIERKSGKLFINYREDKGNYLYEKL